VCPDSLPVTMQYAYAAEHEGQNTGGALAVTKGLTGKFPQHFVW